MNAERIRLLSLVDILEPLTGEEIENLNGQLPDRRLQMGEIFFGPQDRSERLFLLQSGRVRIFRTTPDGREFTLAVVEAGTVFGEMALTGQRLEGAYAQALAPSQVSTMLRADLERLILEKPEVGLQIMQLLSERLRRQEMRLEDATMKDITARLAGIMIGVNRVAVTRAFGLLQDEGVVQLRRRLIQVPDLEALKRSAAYPDAQG